MLNITVCQSVERLGVFVVIIIVVCVIVIVVAVILLLCFFLGFLNLDDFYHTINA